MTVAIGLMSGTSLDGVDVALVDTDGIDVAGFGPTGYRPYSEAERTLLRQALEAAVTLTDRTARPGALAAAETLVTDAHAEAVESLLGTHDIDSSRVDLIGFHGQTVLHRPQARLTVQIGDAFSLARRLRMAVAHDFRAADVAAGGQGAPLVPIFHQALVRGLRRPRPVAVLNVGGVANLTYLDDGEPIAGDTGPGNALVDDFVRARTGQSRDQDGAYARRGRVDEDFIEEVLRHEFFATPPPKSLDRNAFAGLDLSGFSLEDGAASLTALTAAAVARSLPYLPRPPATWIVAGGGARNPTLMRTLAERLAPATVETADHTGWSSDALEAQAFAYLAVRRVRELPITFPTTTAAPRPLTGGIVVRP